MAGPITLVVDRGRGGGREDLGLAHNASFFHEDLDLTLVELDRLVEAGLLRRLEAEQLEIEFRFDSLRDWRDFVDRPRGDRLEVDPGRLAAAEATVAGRSGAILAVEAQIAIAYLRV